MRARLPRSASPSRIRDRTRDAQGFGLTAGRQPTDGTINVLGISQPRTASSGNEIDISFEYRNNALHIGNNDPNRCERSPQGVTTEGLEVVVEAVLEETGETLLTGTHCVLPISNVGVSNVFHEVATAPGGGEYQIEYRFSYGGTGEEIGRVTRDLTVTGPPDPDPGPGNGDNGDGGNGNGDGNGNGNGDNGDGGTGDNGDGGTGNGGTEGGNAGALVSLGAVGLGVAGLVGYARYADRS